MPIWRGKGKSPDTRTVDPNEPFQDMPTSPADPTMSAVDEDRIRERAHEIWQEEGRPEGRADEHWRRAEGELRHRGIKK